MEEEEESSRTCVKVIPLGLTSYTKYCNPLSPNSSFLIESSYSAVLLRHSFVVIKLYARIDPVHNREAYGTVYHMCGL